MVALANSEIYNSNLRKTQNSICLQVKISLCERQRVGLAISKVMEAMCSEFGRCAGFTLCWTSRLSQLQAAAQSGWWKLFKEMQALLFRGNLKQ